MFDRLRFHINMPDSALIIFLALDVMKKLRKPRKVRINVATKRHKRALRSKAKRAHRLGTGFKDAEETA
ncbi:MAG: hypothetical protein KDK39_12760 [Leptospiraceae bacterium]|nr:hypothetical protein [Leptospiraceae bacterium]